MVFYTYELYDPILKMKYIGSRTKSGIISVEDDFEYKGSVASKKWKDLWPEISKRSEKRILGIFMSAKEALNHEIDLHKFYGVEKNENFFNEARQTSTKFSYSGLNQKLSEEHKLNISIAKKGIIPVWTEESKQRLIDKKIGENNPMYGKKVIRTCCEYCGKDVAKNIYIQYHGEKCKFK